MATAKKQDSIGLRISTENKEILQLAAEYMGQDLTSYVISSALDKARKDLVEHQKVEWLLLSKKDFNKVKDEIESPSKPNEKLKSAFGSR